MAKQVFRVADMHCSACVMRLEDIEDTLVGITRVTASYRKQQLEVEYDPQRLTVTEIIAAVQRRGYEAIPL
jgi:copper chaperone CopZ